MEDTDAELFDKFVEKHWGINAVYNPEAELAATKNR